MRWKRILLVTAIVAVAVANWNCRPLGLGPTVNIRGRDIRSVEVRKYVHEPGQKRRLERVGGGMATDPNAAEALALALRGKGRSADHKCVPDGVLVLELRSGETVELNLLVAHVSGRYEYRTKNGNVSMDRAALLAALKPFGVDQLPGEEQAAMDGR